MKLISYYTGSDARWLIHLFPTDLRKIPYILFTRLIAYLLKPFIYQYWIDHDYLYSYILEFNPKANIRVIPPRLKYNKKIPKRYHNNMNILYYYPKNEYNKEYCRWCYGIDIINDLINRYPMINWIRADGSLDLDCIFPIVDLYIRPNRHDGASRLVLECQIQEIPYYHTHCDPDINEIIKIIDKDIEKWNIKKK